MSADQTQEKPYWSLVQPYKPCHFCNVPPEHSRCQFFVAFELQEEYLKVRLKFIVDQEWKVTKFNGQVSQYGKRDYYVICDPPKTLTDEDIRWLRHDYGVRASMPL